MLPDHLPPDLSHLVEHAHRQHLADHLGRTTSAGAYRQSRVPFDRAMSRRLDQDAALLHQVAFGLHPQVWP